MEVLKEKEEEEEEMQGEKNERRGERRMGMIKIGNRKKKKMEG